MSWVVTFFAGLLGMLSGAAGTFAIANACVKWYSISSFEGKSGYYIIGSSILGAKVGLLLSIVAARLAYALVGTEWYIQFVAALAVVLFSLAICLAISYSGVDRVPERDGKRIDTVWEIRLPLEGTDKFIPGGDPRTWPADELRIQLVSVSNHKPRGAETAKLDRDAFRKDNDQWIIVGRVPLFTSKGVFCVNLTLGGRDDGFWPAMRPTLHPGYFQWSMWTRTNKSSNRATDDAAVMYRFKYEQAIAS